MPRVNVVWLPEYDEYLIVSDEELEAFREIDPERDFEVYVAEIPRTRLKYWNEASARWEKAQAYLETVAELSRKTPGKVRRFK